MLEDESMYYVLFYEDSILHLVLPLAMLSFLVYGSKSMLPTQVFLVPNFVEARSVDGRVTDLYRLEEIKDLTLIWWLNANK